MSDHEQTKVFYPGYEEIIEVDRGIAPLLQVLWNTGVMTCNSCQEYKPGVTWIEFYSVEDAEEFVTMLVRAMAEDVEENPDADDWLFYRISGWQGEERDPWKYEAHPNMSPGEPSTKIAFTVSVRFPSADCPRIIDLLSGFKDRPPCNF